MSKIDFPLRSAETSLQSDCSRSGTWCLARRSTNSSCFVNRRGGLVAEFIKGRRCQKINLQEIHLTLQQYWNDQGCMLMRAYDNEKVREP